MVKGNSTPPPTFHNKFVKNAGVLVYNFSNFVPHAGCVVTSRFVGSSVASMAFLLTMSCFRWAWLLHRLGPDPILPSWVAIVATGPLSFTYCNHYRELRNYREGEMREMVELYTEKGLGKEEFVYTEVRERICLHCVSCIAWCGNNTVADSHQVQASSTVSSTPR